MPQLNRTHPLLIVVFGMFVICISSLIGCTQKTTYIQKNSVLVPSKTTIKLDLVNRNNSRETNTNQPPESLSETQLSKIENSNNLDNPSKLPIRQPKSITKLSIGDKKDSQYVYRNPKELLGMGSLSVSDLLGIPSLLRKETPAEVWQYVSEDCILNIYMYEDAISPEGFEVTYYEFNQVPEKKNSDEICFSKSIKHADTTPNNSPLT